MPYERLMESPDISDERKGELRRRKASYNSVELNSGLNEAVRQFLNLKRKKTYGEPAFRPGG
jgi:hypothetical protein